MTPHIAATLLLAADETTGTTWYDVASKLGLILAGGWATWAQWIYPQIVKRREARRPPEPPRASPAAAVDPLVLMIQQAEQRASALAEDLEEANRAIAADAGTIGRLTAERDEAVRRRDQLQHDLDQCRRHLDDARWHLEEFRRRAVQPPTRQE